MISTITAPVRRVLNAAPCAALLFIAPAVAAGSGLSHAVVRNDRPEAPADDGGVVWPIDCHLNPSRPAPVQRGTADDLLLRFTAFHSAMRYVEAAEAARMLIERVPDRPQPYFNLACALSRLGRVDEAISSLRRAIELGWRRLALLQIDPDLDRVRRSPAWNSIVLDVRSRLRAERLPARPLRTEPVEVIATELAAGAPDLMKRSFVPGLAVSLVRDGRTAWTRAFGTLDAAGMVPITSAAMVTVATPADLLTILAAAWENGAAVGELADAFASMHAGGSTDDDGRRILPTAWPSLPARRQPLPDADETLLTLRLLVELAADAPLERYCESQLLEPQGVTWGRFLPGEARGEAVMHGHSPLGTPLPVLTRGEFRGPAVQTGVVGLAMILEVLLGNEQRLAAAGLTPAAAGDAARLCAAARLPSGLQVTIAPTGDDLRLQLVEVSAGAGFLMRWFPSRGNGVVVVFNAATGPDAAARLAHIALGGW